MKRLNCEKMRLLLIVFLAAIVLVGGNAKADFTFGEPVEMGSMINTSYCEEGLTISADGLTLFFSSDRPPHYENWELYMATRETTDDTWNLPENLGSIVNSPQNECYPSISADGLELYFCSPSDPSQDFGSGGTDLWVTKRASVFDPWGTPENLGSIVNSASHDVEPCISANGLELYFCSTRPGGHGYSNIWITTRQTKDDSWSYPSNLGTTINYSDSEGTPNITSDGLVLFFTSNRSDGYGSEDIWMTRRMTTSDSWGEPINLGPAINDSDSQVMSCISPDGHTIYFRTIHPDTCYDFMQAPIIPIVDFNNDEIIDFDDLLIMVDNWSTNESLCDIGPMPWGDGVVDIEDLKVFIKYWEQENMPQEPEIPE